jgi:predicted ATPase/DNA-binding SARP family transcriptional activator
MDASLTSAAQLSITLFGPMQALVQGRPLPHMRSRKGQWLLALLTLRHGRPVEREWLAGTLWPDVDQSQAFDNLRPILSELRRGLGNQSVRLLAPDRRTLLLDLGGADVDVLRFDAAIESGKLSNLEQAVALYRGPLLEGCNEEWVFQERAAREQECIQALQRLGHTALTGGDYEKAITHFQRVVRIDPWEEVARRGWMEALAKRGDTNAALQVYRDFLAVLKGDPKAAPDEKTSALYQRLRSEARRRAGTHPVTSAQAGSAPVAKGYLPHPLTELVGREDEREDVAALLRRSRLVTLTGPGGIGKTRLAIEIANEAVEEHTHGVWLVTLESLSESTLIANQIASVLGLQEERGHTLLQSVTEHLRKKKLLLVLDNCEHMLEASAQVAAHLLKECGGLRILATSREVLGITGESPWPVPALAFPDIEHLPQGQATLLRVLMGYESVQLFVERAQSIQKTFALRGSNARTVAQVCAQLEGIPLAIELAAARVKALTVEQIAERLDNELELLTGGSRTALTRQQTLRATLDWSHDLLAEPERTLLRRLSVFAGGWALEAAEVVCTDEGGSTKDVSSTPYPSSLRLHSSDILDLLCSLVDKSLVVFEQQERQGDGRYHLLEMVRQYAHERLGASGETEEVRERLLDWCVALAEEAEPQLRGADQEKWICRIEKEYGNIRTALKFKHGQAGSRLAAALWRYWYVRGDYTEGLQYLSETLFQKENESADAIRGKCLYGAGVLTANQGDYASAQPLLEESLSIRRELEDRQGIADSLNDLGNSALVTGEYAHARELYSESLKIRHELQDWRAVADSLLNLGKAIRSQGDYAAAQAMYEESLSIYRKIGDVRRIAYSLINLAYLANNHEDYALARPLLEESLSLSRELGDRANIAWALHILVHVAISQGDLASARAHQEEGLAIFKEIGNGRGVAWSVKNLGDISFHEGDYASAQTLYTESLKLFKEVGDRIGVAESVESVALMLQSAGQVLAAVHVWGSVHVMRESIGAQQDAHIQKQHDRRIQDACTELGEETFSAAWEEGCALTWEQAVEEALRM